MQNADTVLGVLRERGRKGLSCKQLYRQLFNPDLYLLAYGRIYSNHGAMTPGATQETADDMSLEKIDAIIEAMRHERYRFAPVRRIHIPKPGGKLRPLGLPTWTDKLVGEVVRLLLEAHYEPQFSDRSHGFRPGRGCHTALREVAVAWTGTTWFIEGDISDCFGSLDHDVMIEILSEKIHDNRFLRLIRNMLTAGYLEDWRWNATLSGAPQGGVVSPVLSNIYLSKLDTFVETVLIPQHTRGERRNPNPAHTNIRQALVRARRRGDRTRARDLQRQMRTLPSLDPHDPGYRRLRYSRYADDHLLGFIGPKAEAEQIKDQLARFLREELKLDLSPTKTLITHARTQAARYLGYDIITQHSDHKITRGRRSANGPIALRVPPDVITAKCAPYLSKGKPEARTALCNLDDYDIVATFGAEYRGIVQYYLLATNVWQLARLRWIAETSLLKTLAAKHRSTVSKTAALHKATIDTPHGRRTCFEARVHRTGKQPLVARFGGIPLARKKDAILTDRIPKPEMPYPAKELTIRLRRGRCELCQEPGKVQVHQVRKLAQLGTPGPGQPPWAALMTRKRRKTLVVCHPCHDAIHHGQPTAPAA
ncbi:reverse transcriptase domain-containing protein [Saccharopolyspora sp. 5N102]|uniref:reverse transcriptase/maturase family protein n=1 Tax=Saccharopolyspora sp. 5N102 TaxID=3375155 RepID=UPI0037933EB4